MQLFCKSYIAVLKKKSNEMTRHRSWKNSNICWKCHKQQRLEQQKPPERGKKPLKLLNIIRYLIKKPKH